MRINFFTLGVAFSIICFVLLNFLSCTSTQVPVKENHSSVVPGHKPFVGRGMIVLDDRPKDNALNYERDSVVEVSLNFVGDLMCHLPQTNYAKTQEGYDFNPSFEWIKTYLEDADITIGNLELTCVGPDIPYSGHPNFNAPDEYITALKNNGFDFLVTANNHSMDMGERGLLWTIVQVKKNKLGYVGTFETQADRDSVRLINIKGINIAILNYTYGTNGAYPDEKRKYLLNLIDSALIVGDIQQAKKSGAELVVVYYHFGVEYGPDPIESQKNAVRWARSAGASIILGVQPYVIGPCRWLVPDLTHADSSFVAWSLGNFISNQNKSYKDAGVILTLRIKKNIEQGKLYFGEASYLPTWVYRADRSEKKMQIIFPSQLAQFPKKIPDFLDSSLCIKMRQAFDDTKQMINKYGDQVKLKGIR